LALAEYRSEREAASGGSGMNEAAGPRHQHGATRMAHHVLDDASQQEPAKAAAFMSRQHDHVAGRVVGYLQDHLAGIALGESIFDVGLGIVSLEVPEIAPQAVVKVRGASVLPEHGDGFDGVRSRRHNVKNDKSRIMIARQLTRHVKAASRFRGQVGCEKNGVELHWISPWAPRNQCANCAPYTIDED
jgi:hypothetical protein